MVVMMAIHRAVELIRGYSLFMRRAPQQGMSMGRRSEQSHMDSAKLSRQPRPNQMAAGYAAANPHVAATAANFITQS
jgi:hypothetical protein